jgi:hypothetical protein
MEPVGTRVPAEANMKYLTSFLLGLTACATFAADDPLPDRIQPTAKLPPQVVAPAGKFTLFADFTKKADEGVPLYLVNRTGKAVEIFTYLGQPLLAVEYQAEPGKWMPARLADFGLCGNSLVAVKLENEKFLTAVAPLPATGFKAQMRYRLDEPADLISNSGVGQVSHDDLTFRLVFTTRDFTLLSKIATGEFVPPTESADYRPLAIRRLASFEKAQAEPVLQRLAAGSEKPYAEEAQRALEFLRKFGTK